MTPPTSGEAMPLVIAPTPCELYELPGPLGSRHVGRFAVGVVIAASLAGGDRLMMPTAAAVRQVSGLRLDEADDAAHRMEAAGLLDFARGAVHAPSLLHGNECGAGLLAYGMSPLRQDRRASLRRVMVELLRRTPYGQGETLIAPHELATCLAYTAATIRAALNALATEYQLIRWRRLPNGIHVRFSLSGPALALIAWPWPGPARRWG